LILLTIAPKAYRFFEFGCKFRQLNQQFKKNQVFF
jgi:hypothetical protein